MKSFYFSIILRLPWFYEDEPQIGFNSFENKSIWRMMVEILEIDFKCAARF